MDFVRESEQLEKFSPVAERRPFEVVLRGGKPWGFSLAGGDGGESALHISQIEEDSKAGNSALLPGDIVLSVNGISCGSMEAVNQLIDSAFRTLTIKVLRGGWDSSRGAARPPLYQQGRGEVVARRERCGPSAHDDSALYAQSKASQHSAMRPSRPRRGDSFTVGKPNQASGPSTTDPPWNRPLPANCHPSSQVPGRSSYPEVRDAQRSSLKSDRRYSDAPSRYQPRDRDRERHLVAAKSSPDLNKAEETVGGPVEAKTVSVKPVKSSSDIPCDLDQDRSNRALTYGQPIVSKSSSHLYGSTHYGLREGSQPGDQGFQSPRVSEDMYTSDMNVTGERKALTSHSLQKYQADYENVSMLGTAPLQSEKISEIDDIEDGTDFDIASMPPRPSAGSSTKIPFSPTIPHRDPSSLKYIKVNQNHEKYPSWPVTQPNPASDPSQPINTRAQSWTDHTNTSKEFPGKQRLAYQPGLRPLQEKNSPITENRGDDTSAKAARNSSDPGLKVPEFDYDHYGRVIQKKKDSDMKGKFEDFYHNSRPGYLPPRVDSDGHSYGDKEYNFPSPPERDVAGVDRRALSQALGAEAGEHRQQMYHYQKASAQSAQSQESQPVSVQRSNTSQGVGQPGDIVGRLTSPANLSRSPPQSRHPGALPLSQGGRDSRYTDTGTSPLASPQDSSPSSCVATSQSQNSAYRDNIHKDSAGGGSWQSNKPYVVRQTPYYNTSTQTDVQSYAVKMSVPRGKHCNVEIQVGDAGSQTLPKVEFEEKSIQARMSREFQPSELDHSSPIRPSSREKQNYFQYPFEGIQSIQAKYATDMDATSSFQSGDVFSVFNSGDQASIMRKLSEEFYGGNKLGLLGEKRHSSPQEHSPKPMDSSSMSAFSGTMSQAESYSSVIIHPSESAGPFGRDDFGSQSSITDSRQDLTCLTSNSRSSLRDSAPRGRNSLEYFPRSAPRPLQESRKFNSLSSISHQREKSAPVGQLRCQNMLTVDTHSQKSGPHRDSSSASEASVSSQPRSPDSCVANSAQSIKQGEATLEVRQPGSRAAVPASQHSRLESVDSVFSEHSCFDPRDRASGNDSGQASSVDGGVGRSGKRTGPVEMLGRKVSMKKAYGIYDESDRVLLSPTKDAGSKAGGSSSLDSGSRGRGSYSDAKQLDQIQEEADSNQSSKEQRSDLVRHRTQEDISETRQKLDSWRNDLEKRTGRAQRPSTEQMLPRDLYPRNFEPASRPQRLFDGSIDSGVGSEISRADSQITPEQSQSNFLAMEKTTGAELKKLQQQAVLNFVQRKTGKPSFPATAVEHSPESSLYESIGTPRSPHSPTSESVSDLISKTNETLAKRADGIRRTGSTSSRASSSDYVDMGRQDRSRRETEWSRLRSSSSFHYNSNRSSLCSENTYEDISVFATPTPRSSTQELPQDRKGQTKDTGRPFEDEYRSHKESDGMASPTYQNYPATASRRPVPPPPRHPSPEPRTPPALPPRNYLQKEEGMEAGEARQGQEPVEEAKIDFKTLKNQWENNSPREDSYVAQLRKQASKFSGQRSSASTAPSSMSVIHTRQQMAISTSFKQMPMVAMEATSPTSCTTASVSVNSSASTAPSLGAGPTSPQRRSSTNISPSTENPASRLSAPKDSAPKPSSVASKDMQSTSASTTTTTTTSCGMPTPMAASREDSQAAQRAESATTGRRDSQATRDRSASEIPHKVTEKPPLAFSPAVSRERSSSDGNVLAKGVTSSLPAGRDNVQNACKTPNDVPLPCPPKADGQGEGIIDPADLPPPPPDLLNDNASHFDHTDQPGNESFADESYGAYRNRSSREVGNYQRSSSAAAVRPDMQGGRGLFGENRLGSQSWNSDSQLQAGRRSDLQQGGSVGTSGTVSTEKPQDTAGNVPVFRADSGPVHGVGKVAAESWPLAAKVQSPARGQDDGKVFFARPLQVGDGARSDKAMSSDHEQPRSVKERISNLERKSSFSTSFSTPTGTSSAQRWASPASYQAANHSVGDKFKQQTANSNSSHVQNPRSLVLSDSPYARDRPPPGSQASAAQESSTQSSVMSRPRAYSERSRNVDASPSTAPKPNQRFYEAPPVASDPRTLPGHVNNTSRSFMERPRSTSSPYNRRESAPAPQVLDTAVVKPSPRRKSEGSFLPSEEDLSTAGGHGRQPSQEELECDQRAKELAREVASSEKKLSDVLSTDAAKKRMKYMDGLFTGAKDADVRTPVSVRRHQSQGSGDSTSLQAQQAQPNLSPSSTGSATEHTEKRNSLPKEYFVSPPKAVLEMEWRKKESTLHLTQNIQDNDALIRQKEELIDKLHKKLDLLKEERVRLQEEIQEIEALGQRVCDTVETKCENRNERDKFLTHISELEKIVLLLLNLSGQLARAENAVQSLSDDADPKLKKMTGDKLEKLQIKHAEAKQLKEDIDKRSDTISGFLQQSLSAEELNDYAYFIKMKSKLTIELQELEDKITLGQEQIEELQKSIPERTVLEDASISSSSTAPSPVPSS